jgi:hypothetical protein
MAGVRTPLSDLDQTDPYIQMEPKALLSYE